VDANGDFSKAVGLSLALLVVSSGCDGKGPEPRPVEYLLYAGMIATPPETPEAFVAVIDCQTDSIVDSIFHGFPSAVLAGASPDGRFFATKSATQPPVLIWDAATKLPIAELPRFIEALSPAFLPDAGILLTRIAARHEYTG